MSVTPLPSRAERLRASDAKVSARESELWVKSIEWLSPSPGRPLSVAEARKVRPLSALSRLFVPPMARM